MHDKHHLDFVKHKEYMLRASSCILACHKVLISYFTAFMKCKWTLINAWALYSENTPKCPMEETLSLLLSRSKKN